MTSIRLIVALAVVLPGFADAQSTNPYNGTWAVAFDGKRTVDLEGTVVVKDEAGTWKVVAQSRKSSCVGLESPIVVQVASADELIFEVQRSKVLTGCKDWTMKLKKIDEQSLSGEFTDGRTVSLTRR